jgi:membrane fusion protein, multidrug efflux system
MPQQRELEPTLEKQESAQPREAQRSPDGQKSEGGGKPEDEKKTDEQKQPPPKPPFGERLRRLPREHPLGLLIAGIVLVIAIVGGFFLMRYLSSYESTDDATIDGHLNGISARVPGNVVAVYVVENQKVEAGQVLVDLDPRDYKVEMMRAQANLSQAQAQTRAEDPNVAITRTTTVTNVAAAKAQLASARAGVTAAQRERDAATARLAEAHANNAKAQADLARYRLLVQKDEISREEFDQRVAAAQASEAQVKAQQSTVAAANQTIDQRRTAVVEAQVQLNQASQNAPENVAATRANLQARVAAAQSAAAALAQAKLNVEYTKIVAPVSGVVGRKSVEVGQRVQAGQMLLAIVPLDDIWVTANYKENQLRHMHPGQSATIHVDAFDANYDGYVESLPAASGAKFSVLPPENATGNYVKVVQRLPVRLRFKPGQDPDHRLRPGMSAEPKVWVK